MATARTREVQRRCAGSGARWSDAGLRNRRPGAVEVDLLCTPFEILIKPYGTSLEGLTREPRLTDIARTPVGLLHSSSVHMCAVLFAHGPLAARYEYVHITVD